MAKFAAFVLLMSLAGLPRAAQEALTLPSFERVSVTGRVDMVLVKDSGHDTGAAWCSIDCLRAMTIEVADGVLYVDVSEGPREERAYLVVPFAQLYEIASTGGSSVLASGLHSPHLAIDLRDSATVHLASVEVADLAVVAHGHARFMVSGVANHQFVEIADSASYSALGLTSDSVHLLVAGAGDVSVWASDWLAVEQAGTATVRFGGRPRVFQRRADSRRIEPI